MRFAYKKRKYLIEIFKKKILHYLKPYNRFVSVEFLSYHGLGNQLFQYAIAKSYSLRHNIPLILSEKKNHKLGSFKIDCNFVDKKNIELVNKETFKEAKFSYDKTFYKFSLRKYFVGNFQSEKYFLSNRQILLDELVLKDKKSIEYCKNYIKEIKLKNNNKPLVALHNRRGDNVPSKRNYNDKYEGFFLKDKHLYHPLLSMNYINKAISYFSNVVFLVFSNNDKDIEWCKNNIKGEDIYYSKGHSDLIDFTLMSMCDHNIIANSSFSWWAAWLNRNPKKIVIAPKLWFGEKYADLDIKDLIPNSWIIM